MSRNLPKIEKMSDFRLLPDKPLIARPLLNWIGMVSPGSGGTRYAQNCIQGLTRR
jgi:hypothetical protein